MREKFKYAGRTVKTKQGVGINSFGQDKCLPSESQKQKIQSIADHYGFRKQSMMMIEECSELQKAICKWHRERGDLRRSESSGCDERTAIIDELADVIIMANQISYLLSAEDEVSEQIEFKLDRQLRRMEEENAD